MTSELAYTRDAASVQDVESHLRLADSHFVPVLSVRVDLAEYAEKIVTNATRFEAWAGGDLIGLVAAYVHQNSTAHITTVSVLESWTGRGIAAALLDQCITFALQARAERISLDVGADNFIGRRLYEKFGFTTLDPSQPIVAMSRDLHHEETQ